MDYKFNDDMIEEEKNACKRAVGDLLIRANRRKINREPFFFWLVAIGEIWGEGLKG